MHQNNTDKIEKLKELKSTTNNAKLKQAITQKIDAIENNKTVVK